MKFKYRVCYGAGHGPNTWDAEMDVLATNIREALDLAEPPVKKAGAEIFSIEQKD